MTKTTLCKKNVSQIHRGRLEREESRRHKNHGREAEKREKIVLEKSIKVRGRGKKVTVKRDWKSQKKGTKLRARGVKKQKKSETKRDTR